MSIHSEIRSCDHIVCIVFCYKPWIFRRKYTSVCVLFTLYRFKSNKAFRMERNREIQTEKWYHHLVWCRGNIMEAEPLTDCRTPYVLVHTTAIVIFPTCVRLTFPESNFPKYPFPALSHFLASGIDGLQTFNCFPLVFLLYTRDHAHASKYN